MSNSVTVIPLGWDTNCKQASNVAYGTDLLRRYGTATLSHPSLRDRQPPY